MDKRKIEACDLEKAGRKITNNGFMGKDKLPHLKIGDVVLFGHYPIEAGQKTDSPINRNPIEWIVVDIKGEKALFVSKYAIENKKYNEEFTGVTWQNCTLRYWLNGYFYRKAFDDEEKKKILPTKIHNEDNSIYSTYAGEQTEDYIFLLSLKEAEDYFADKEARICRTDTKKTESGRLDWWLRSPGNFDLDAAVVISDGALDGDGFTVISEFPWVRPAFYYNLKS